MERGIMIRRICLADAPEIQVINKEQLGYDYSVEKTKEQLNKVLRDEKNHYLMGYEDETTGKIQYIVF